MSYRTKQAKRMKRANVKKKRGPISMHKAESRDEYYARKRRPRRSDLIGPCS